MFEQIAEKRKQNGQSRREVADKVGVSEKTLMRWEKEESQPSFDHVKAWCEAVKLDWRTLDKHRKNDDRCEGGVGYE